MGEAILGVIVLALLAFHARQARTWAEERRYLINLDKTANPAEFTVLQRASTPATDDFPGLIGGKAKPHTPPRIAPLGL